MCPVGFRYYSSNVGARGSVVTYLNDILRYFCILKVKGMNQVLFSHTQEGEPASSFRYHILRFSNT